MGTFVKHLAVSFSLVDTTFYVLVFQCLGAPPRPCNRQEYKQLQHGGATGSHITRDLSTTYACAFLPFVKRLASIQAIYAVETITETFAIQYNENNSNSTEAENSHFIPVINKCFVLSLECFVEESHDLLACNIIKLPHMVY
jgi:hypothetical protein